MLKNPAVALVHDYLNQYGGGERVLEALSLLYPQAPIYTLFYDERRTGYAFAGRDVRVSFLQHFPWIHKMHHLFPLLMPLAVESFDLSAYDLVISSSASYAKGVLTGTNTLHIAYCHTPTRYLWQDAKNYIEDARYPKLLRWAIPLAAAYLRVWDREASARPDLMLTNSHFVQKRIAKYYARESQVVYPPVNFGKFAYGTHAKEPGQYFLLVGRFVPYKRFDIAVEACTRLRLPLTIIGDGPEREHLMRKAGPSVRFVGLVSDNTLPEFYKHAYALILPQEEDFGITALECMASGKPVIAYRSGGALETVREGVSGMFFNEQTPEALILALKNFNRFQFDADVIRRSAEAFDRSRFLAQMKEIIDRNYHEALRG